MDENNTNLENNSTTSQPGSYGAPTEAEKAEFGKAPESSALDTASQSTDTETSSENTIISSVSGQASSPLSGDANPSKETSTSGTQSAFEIPESTAPQQSTSHQEVFGGSVEGTPSGNYYTNTNASSVNAPEEISKGFAIASLVMGILSILTCCCWIISIIFAVLGIIFFFVQPKDSEGNRPTMATIGLILSIVGLVVAIGLVVIGLVSSGSDFYKEVLEQANM